MSSHPTKPKYENNKEDKKIQESHKKQSEGDGLPDWFSFPTPISDPRLFRRLIERYGGYNLFYLEEGAETDKTDTKQPEPSQDSGTREVQNSKSLGYKDNENYFDDDEEDYPGFCDGIW